LAKPGLPGRSSNSSEQTTQVLMGKAIHVHDNAEPFSAFHIAQPQEFFGMDVEWDYRTHKRN
jgi:hypothetical protein